MGRFYFDINDGKTRVSDDRGQELKDLNEARDLAYRELGLMIRDEMPDGDHEKYVITVRDAGGKPVFLAAAMLLGEMLGED